MRDRRSESVEGANKFVVLPFIYQKTIDHAVYLKQKDRIQEELTIAELELNDARIDALDVEGVLAFAEPLIANVGRIWFDATLDQRQRIQAAIFPDGIPFDRRSGDLSHCLRTTGRALTVTGRALYFSVASITTD